MLDLNNVTHDIINCPSMFTFKIKLVRWFNCKVLLLFNNNIDITS